MLLLALALVLGPGSARPVHTYSIVARDRDDGRAGGRRPEPLVLGRRVVPWAEAGVGAVATQSFVDPSYGPLGPRADERRAGRRPRRWRRSLAGDPGREVRQVGMVDAQGQRRHAHGQAATSRGGRPVGRGVRRAGEPDGQGDRLAGHGARVRGGEGRPGGAAAGGARRRAGGRRRHPRPAVGRAARGEGRRRPAGRGRTACSTSASRTMPSRWPSCGDWWACSAPTTAWSRATTASRSRTGPAPSASTARREAMQPDNAEMAFWHAVALAVERPPRAGAAAVPQGVRRRPALARAGPAPSRRRAAAEGSEAARADPGDPVSPVPTWREGQGSR